MTPSTLNSFRKYIVSHCNSENRVKNHGHLCHDKKKGHAKQFCGLTGRFFGKPKESF